MKMERIPGAVAPTARSTPISRVFSTTVMVNVAKIVKQATRTMKLRTNERMIFSLLTAASSGRCRSSHVFALTLPTQAGGRPDAP